MLGSMLGSPYFGKLPSTTLAHEVQGQRFASAASSNSVKVLQGFVGSVGIISQGGV